MLHGFSERASPLIAFYTTSVECFTQGPLQENTGSSAMESTVFSTIKGMWCPSHFSPGFSRGHSVVPLVLPVLLFYRVVGRRGISGNY